MGVYIYGKTLPIKWGAFAGEGYADGDRVAIAELVSARIYRDAPTEAQLEDSAAALGGFTGTVKTAFSASDTTNLVYTVSYDAIDDPDPHSTVLYDTWHPVWNVRYEASEQIQFLHKPIEIWRPVAQLSQLAVTYDDIYRLESEIRKQLGSTKTAEKIGVAQDDIFRRIKNKGLDRNKLQEVDLTEAVTYYAAALCLYDMATRQNSYFDKAEYWEAKYEKLWTELRIGYDVDGDGSIGPEEVKTTWQPVWAVR